VQQPLGIEALTELARESLSSFAVEVGLRMAQCLLEDEVTQRCGPRHERDPSRTQSRHGPQRGFVTLGGQKLPIPQPRVRQAGGGSEVELERYALLQSSEALPEAALRRLVNGVSCRRYEQVVDTARAASRSGKEGGPSELQALTHQKVLAHPAGECRARPDAPRRLLS
jgi:hypothetical protein